MQIIVQHIISYIKDWDIATESFVSKCGSMRFALTLFHKMVHSFTNEDHEYNEIWDTEAKIYWWDKHLLKHKYPASCSDIFILVVDEDWGKYKLNYFEDYSE